MKLSNIFEAKYYRETDKFECPDCDGKGGFFFRDADGNIEDMEMCDMCQGKGHISSGVAQHLVRYGSYKQHELKRITEAKYAEPRTMKRVGMFHYDDRQADEIYEIPKVAVEFTVDHDADHNEEFNASIIRASNLDGKEIDILNKLGIGRGTEARYQLDKFGWMLSGWKVGPGAHSPWAFMEERQLYHSCEMRYTSSMSEELVERARAYIDDPTVAQDIADIIEGLLDMADHADWISIEDATPLKLQEYDVLLDGHDEYFGVWHPGRNCFVNQYTMKDLTAVTHWRAQKDAITEPKCWQCGFYKWQCICDTF